MPTPKANIARVITWRYALALSLVACLSSGAFLGLYHTISAEEKQAALLRLVAKQEASSMRTAFFANAYAVAPDALGRETYLRELKRSIQDMERRHELIINGSQKLGFLESDIARVNELMFLGKNPFDGQVRSFLENAKRLTAVPRDELVEEHPYLLALNLAGTNFIPQGFDLISDILKDEREQTLIFLERFEIAVWLSTLTLLVLEALLIFRPLVRRVRSAMADLEFAEAEARDKSMAAEAANHAQSRFLANMNHDIRTPLNGIIGTLALLSRSDLDARQREHVAMIRDSSETLLELIEEMLDLSRLEAGALSVERGVFNAGDLVRSVARMLSAAAEAKGLDLCTRIDADLEIPVLGDAAHLKQVLMNLTANAVKFTQSGSVEMVAERRSEQILRFEVRDTGPGIAAEDLTMVFERFRQGLTRDPSQNARSSSGLGLAICRELVALMEGEIGVDSTLGAGAAFWIELPLPPAPEIAQPEALPKSASPAAPQPAGPGGAPEEPLDPLGSPSGA